LKSIGESCFKIGKTCIDGFIAVSENKVAETIIKLYSLGYICEPSGALAVAGLSKIRNEIAGKKVVCILTGSNMDLLHLEQARELNAISKNRINYLIVELSNKKSGVYDLLTKCFRKNDVVSIQYVKRFNKNVHKAVLSVESASI
jgi:threonine dehydratase